MKNAKWMGVLAAGMVLSSCGAVVGAFVPPIPLDNPLNLEKKKLTTDALEIIKNDVGASANQTVVFEDIDPGDTKGLAPNTIEGTVNFGSVTVSGGCATPLANLPTSFQIRVKNVKVTVSDSGNGTTESTASPNPLVINVNGAPTIGALTATYTLAGNPGLSIGFGRKLFDIVTKSPDSNQATIEGTVEIDNNAFEGCTVGVEISNQDVVLKNFS